MKKTFAAWEDIFKAKRFDLESDLHFIDAAEIDSITGLQPRLMAKVDSSRDLPPVFSRNGYFLLPVRNGRYAIVRGDGFHRLAEAADSETHLSKLPFQLTTAGRGQGEMQYLDYAFNTGALEEIAKVGNLYQSIRGREYTRRFDFRVCKTMLDVESVQIEVDSGLESETSIVLIEAKVRTPEDFIIRQLYYPYRHFRLVSPRKKIAPIFFTYEPAESAYKFWRYKFRDENDYNSIELEETRTLTIETPDPIQLEDIKPKNLVEVKYKDLVPQANDLDKVLELVYKVHEGVDDYRQIASHFEFNPRQSSYYREAAEALGLVIHEGGKYKLTETGKHLADLPTEDRHIFFTELLADFSLIKNVLEQIGEGKTVSSENLERLIEAESNLTGTTISRRANSLAAWLRWIANHTGTFRQIGRNEFAQVK